MTTKKFARTHTSDAKFRELLRAYREYNVAQEALRADPTETALRSREVRSVSLLETAFVVWLDDILQ